MPNVLVADHACSAHCRGDGTPRLGERGRRLRRRWFDLRFAGGVADLEACVVRAADALALVETAATEDSVDFPMSLSVLFACKVENHIVPEIGAVIQFVRMAAPDVVRDMISGR